APAPPRSSCVCRWRISSEVLSCVFIAKAKEARAVPARSCHAAGDSGEAGIDLAFPLKSPGDDLHFNLSPLPVTPQDCSLARRKPLTSGPASFGEQPPRRGGKAALLIRLQPPGQHEAQKRLR